MNQFTHYVAINRVFVEKVINGKKKTIPVTTRKLFLTLPPVLDSGRFRIVLRSGKFTISAVPRGTAQPWWTNPEGRIASWRETPADDAPYRRTDDPAMDTDGVYDWLRRRIGAADALRLLAELSGM